MSSPFASFASLAVNCRWALECGTSRRSGRSLRPSAPSAANLPFTVSSPARTTKFPDEPISGPHLPNGRGDGRNVVAHCRLRGVGVGHIMVGRAVTKLRSACPLPAPR